MINKLKERAEITEQDPIFTARYIGAVETYVASGKGCTMAPVQRLWDNAREERDLRRVSVKINPTGLHMKFTERKREPEKYFNIENISFCNVDTAVNDRIFSFIYKGDDDALPLECHAFVCSSSEKAKSMALVLSRAFQIAYKEWKTNRNKLVREVAKSERSVSLEKMSRSLSQKDSRSQTDTLSETASSSGSEPGPSYLSNGASHVIPASGTSERSSMTETGVQVDFDTCIITTSF